ncbi:Uncharacterised protein [Paenibacillus macerans]|nr:Uncharacterised protein [Paenibacillus macerans]
MLPKCVFSKRLSWMKPGTKVAERRQIYVSQMFPKETCFGSIRLEGSAEFKIRCPIYSLNYFVMERRLFEQPL